MGMFLRRGPAPHRTRMSDLEIGRSIKLNLNGTPWDWLVVHQGLPSSIYDASCDGTWLLLKNIYEIRQWNSTYSNVLETSTVQSYLGGDFLNLFDGNIKGAIKQVKIPYHSGSGSGGTDQSGANGLLCKIFLLSGPEVGMAGANYVPNDGAKLDYFNANTEKDSKRIAYLNGNANYWWLRSPYTDDTGSVFRVYANGYCSYNNATNQNGIRPAIILPSDMLVTDDMLLPANIKTMTMIGSYFGYGYVMAGDTKYTRAGEVFVEIGTAIVAHVGAPDSTGAAGCKIYFNGTLVKTGTSSYSFTLKGNVQITFKRPDSSTSAIECYIVEQ